MKLFQCLVPVVLSASVLAGCGNSNTDTASAPPAPAEAPRAEAPRAEAPASAPGAKTISTGLPKGSVKVGDHAVCAICAVKEGNTAKEETKAVLDYQGKTYAFCNLDEKAEFISNPTKYAK